ncbi:MAG: hypothetical protein ACTSRA_18225 [Promethearchaeota archaeon]
MDSRKASMNYNTIEKMKGYILTDNNSSSAFPVRTEGFTPSPNLP